MLTRTQRNIIAAIEAGHTTTRAIAEAIGLASNSDIARQLRTLARDGHIVLDDGPHGLVIADGRDYAAGWDAAVRDDYGLLTPAELAARQELRDRAEAREHTQRRQIGRSLKRRQAQAMRSHSVRRPFPPVAEQGEAAQSAPAPSTGHLIILGVLCLVSSFAVMALWSIVLGFVLAIVAALVIAGAAIGGE